MAIIIPALPYTLTNGTTADANQVMADLNDIVSGVNTNAAHNGPNSDITSLTGLTTPLSIAQGGTGVGVVGAAGTIPVSDGSAFAWSNTVNGPLSIKGVIDGSNAAAGQVGEYLSFNQPGVGLANGTWTSIGSVSLSPGDWDAVGFALVTGVSGITTAGLGLGLIANAAPSANTQSQLVIGSGAAVSVWGAPTGTLRYNVTSNTTVQLNIYVAWTSGTPNVVGLLRARRVR
jgi:hypothetical protein